MPGTRQSQQSEFCPSLQGFCPMFVAALQHAGLRLLADHAVSLLRNKCTMIAAYEPMVALPLTADQAPVLIHDFSPDPERSVSWVSEITTALPSAVVFALLGSPATPALRAILRAPRFPCGGAVIGLEERPTTLASQLAAARGSGELRPLRSLITTTWRLDGPLPRIVDSFVLDPRGHHTIHSLLHETGVGRKTFVREAERAGFAPPLRFLQVTRVLGATLVLQHGHTAERTAEHLGYASGDTMRHHFLALYGASPRVARAAGPASVAARIRERGLIDSMFGGRLSQSDGQFRLPLKPGA